uniref:Uncharacterized protein n=1 Tax=Meloidogyne hapla TaxID=6305 RepID=A0A1I8BCB4_MELHA
MCERMVAFYYFLSSPRFVSKRSFSAISSLKVRGDYRSRPVFSLNDRDEKNLPWSQSYRLWKRYRPEHDATQLGKVYNDRMYRDDNKVSQREQKTQNWWSTAKVEEPVKEQHATSRNDRYIVGRTAVSERLNFQNQSKPNHVSI